MNNIIMMNYQEKLVKKLKNKYKLNSYESINIVKISETEVQIIKEGNSYIENNQSLITNIFDDIGNFMYKFFGENSLSYILNHKVINNYKKIEYNQIVIFKIYIDDENIKNIINECKIINKDKLYDYKIIPRGSNDVNLSAIKINCNKKTDSNIYNLNKIKEYIVPRFEHNSNDFIDVKISEFQNFKGYLLMIIFFKVNLNYKPLLIFVPNFILNKE